LPQFSRRSTEQSLGVTVRRKLRPPASVSASASIAFAIALGAAPFVALGCSSARYSTEPGAPSLVLPARLGEGKGEPSAAPHRAPPPALASGSAPSGSASAASAEPAPPPQKPSTLPDPAPLRMAEQVEYQLELKDGKVRVVSVKAVKLPAPIVTPRRVGRYAIELTIGKELIDRVRFDFPATAADDPPVAGKKPLFAPLTLSEHAIGHVTVLLPQSPRVRRAALVDRALETATDIEWPLPDVPKAVAPAPSGSPAPAPPSSVTPASSTSAAPAAASAAPPYQP